MPVQVLNPDLPFRSPSPTSSSATTTTLAERRQTKTSRYLGSQDFKSDFAVKLQSVRERERTALAPLPPSPSPCQIPLPLSPPAHPISFQTPHNRPTSSTPSAHSSSAFPSTSRQSVDDDDDDDHGARYEVIRKLADQLSEQIETNDNLLYELGVMRASQARLLAAAADRDDELACLRQRIDTADATADERATQLNQAHRALCRLQLRPSPLPPTSLPSPRNAQSRRCSWPSPAFLSPALRTAGLSHQPACQVLQPDTSAPSSASLLTQMGHLCAELRDCQDARAAAEATLIAFMELFRAQPTVVDSLYAHPARPDQQPEKDHADDPPAAPRRWGLGILRGGAEEGGRRASVPLPSQPQPQPQPQPSAQATKSPFAGFGFRWRRRSETVAAPLDEGQEAESGEAEAAGTEAKQPATRWRRRSDTVAAPLDEGQEPEPCEAEAAGKEAKLREPRLRQRSDTVAAPINEAQEAEPGEAEGAVKAAETAGKEAEQWATPFRFNLGGFFGGSPRTDDVMVGHMPAAPLDDGLLDGKVEEEEQVKRSRSKLVIGENGE